MKSGVQPWIGCGSKAGWLTAGAPSGAALLGMAAADQLRVGGFAEHDPRVGPLPAQHAADAGDGAAGAIAGHEIVEPRSGEIIDDLARRRRFVDGGIGLGLELAGKEPAVGLGQFDRLLVHAEALLGARRQHHLGAQHAHQLAALDGEAVGHGHDQRIALLRADHGKPDAGIAAGRLDHGLAGLQRAAALGLLDDVERQPVLHRSGRIEELGLHVDRRVADAEIVDPDGRRVADRIENAVEEAAAPGRGSGRCLT